MQRPAASAATWTHLKDNWERVERSFGIFQGIPRVVEGTQHLCDAASKDDVERFFKVHHVAGTTRSLAQSLETVERCVAMRTTQAKYLAAFLADPARH